MYNQSLLDKLLDLSKNHAGEIAELWHKAIIGNPRTKSYRDLEKDLLLNQSVVFYKNLKQIFFSDNPYAETEHFLGLIHYADYAYEHKVPLCEAVYALILMRRYIWLFAETQSILYNSALEMYQALESINRTILIFDYASYIIIQQYAEMDRMKQQKR